MLPSELRDALEVADHHVLEAHVKISGLLLSIRQARIALETGDIIGAVCILKSEENAG